MLAISNKTLKIVAAAATVSEKTKAAKNLQNQKKTSSKYRANESRVELAQTMPSAADIMQHRTDGTDAFDTLYIGAEKFPYRESYAFPTTGIL